MREMHFLVIFFFIKVVQPDVTSYYVILARCEHMMITLMLLCLKQLKDIFIKGYQIISSEKRFYGQKKVINKIQTNRQTKNIE